MTESASAVLSSIMSWYTNKIYCSHLYYVSSSKVVTYEISIILLAGSSMRIQILMGDPLSSGIYIHQNHRYLRLSYDFDGHCCDSMKDVMDGLVASYTSITRGDNRNSKLEDWRNKWKIVWILCILNLSCFRFNSRCITRSLMNFLNKVSIHDCSTIILCCSD